MVLTNLGKRVYVGLILRISNQWYHLKFMVCRPFYLSKPIWSLSNVIFLSVPCHVCQSFYRIISLSSNSEFVETVFTLPPREEETRSEKAQTGRGFQRGKCLQKLRFWCKEIQPSHQFPKIKLFYSALRKKARLGCIVETGAANPWFENLPRTGVRCFNFPVERSHAQNSEGASGEETIFAFNI